jgi:L-alanine-DL-glutamate epimerase-like enolase superfamily enzyme
VGLENSRLCEFPQELKSLAYELTSEHLLLNPNGEIQLPEKPGLGLEPDRAALQKYLVDTQISVNGKVLYQTPQL